MRMFESVTVAVDPPNLDVALAIRAALEAFHLRVHLYHCVQKRNVLDVLGGNVPVADYVVLVCGGYVPPQAEGLHPVRLVDFIDGAWHEVDLWLTPDVIRQTVRMPGRTVVVAGGCNSGSRGLVEAFLDTGCQAYIAPAGPLDADAAVLFTVGFFYHLLQEERDPRVACSAEEAVRRAAAMDALAGEGTHVYRYFSR